jgi:hypothetical protein
MAKEKQTLPMSLEDEIKKQLQAQRGQLGALPSNKISTKGKEFTLPNGQKGKEIEVVILDFVWFMVNYPGVYNANNPQQPNCFAVGRENPASGELKPHEDAADPQHTDCKDCPKNQWKSAPSGNGKACKNQRRLAVLPPDADAGAEPMSLYVSPGGLKHFDAYVSRLASEHNMLPVQVVTKISFDPDQTYPLLRFEMVSPNDDLQLFWSKRDSAQDLLFRPLETEKSKVA